MEVNGLNRINTTEITEQDRYAKRGQSAQGDARHSTGGAVNAELPTRGMAFSVI